MKKLVMVILLVIFISSCIPTGKVVNDVNTCEDTDGSDKMVRGEVTFVEEGRRFLYEDRCVSTRRVKEGVCKDGTLDVEYLECAGNSRCRFGKCRYVRP